MPTFRHGKGSRVFVDGYDLSRQLRSVQPQMGADVAETTAFLSGAKTFVPGIPEMSVACEGMFSYDNTLLGDIDNVTQAIMAQETAVAITVGLDNGVTVGKAIKSGMAFESDVNVSGSITDIVALTANFKVTDSFFGGLALSDADNVAALTGVAVTGVGQDYTAFATNITPTVQMKNGGICTLHVMTNTVNAGTTLKIQHSTAIGGTYVDLATFTIPTVTKAGYWSLVAPGTAVDKFIRYNITATGTGNLKFLCTFAPRTPQFQVA